MTTEKTIITPTKRLSRFLHYRHAQTQINIGLSAWNTLDCLPWQAWCLRTVNRVSVNLDEPYQILTQQQQLWHWQNIIQQSRYRDQLLQVRATAKQALSAYSLCKQWQIPIFPDEVFLSEDAIAFRHWYQNYQARKLEHNWLDEAELPDYLGNHLHHVEPNKTICFYGFDYLTKQQQLFIEQLQQAEITVTIERPDKKNKLTSIYKAVDKKQEILAAASWARQKLTEEPDANIGILTPRLNQQRDIIARLMTQSLSPERLIVSNNNNADIWSISLGKPLKEYSIISIALILLSLGKRRISINDLGKLLHSRYIQGYAKEFTERAMLDFSLRKSGVQEISLKSFYRFAENNSEKDAACSTFIQHLKDFEITYLSFARTQTFRQWSECFTKLLQSSGWPGETELDSASYQTLESWREHLIELGRLDDNGRKINYQTALSQLRYRIAEARFQPETEETSIQISGLEASAAMQFDYLWVLDMQDDVWPEAVINNPFIPLSCQRDYLVPEATADLRLQQAQTMTQRLKDSSIETVFSYSLFDGDRECRASTLIETNLNNENILQIEFQSSPQNLIYQTANIETFEDSVIPYQSAGDKVAGGSALFKDQSLCPFRAFANQRLFAQSLPTIEIGLSASERGKLIHRTLQYLWQRIGDYEKLEYLSENELDKLIQSVVQESLKQHAEKSPDLFPLRFSELEQQRLQNLIKEWLEIEITRESFKVIETEHWQSINFEGLLLHLCIDRIDMLADGRYAIIDYKTGRVSKNDWESDNPNDPQLPLYAVTTDFEIAAVAFASLKPGQLAFKGLTDSDDVFPGVKSNPDYNWQQQLTDWQVVLSSLANDFKQGVATVEPLETACRYCDLHGLCRIHERISTSDNIKLEMQDE